ncbi:MAG: CRAL-TRIO domain-containing protein [Benniella sp.]|nr:MAG: CRAL-TRIO domain-containing protein [Benniella sp.]
MPVPETSTLAKHQPRFTPSQDCIPPAPLSPLSDAQAAALDALRDHIHTTVAKTDPQRRWADDPCLIRYLKARKWNLHDAQQALQDTITWRDQFKPDVPDKDTLWTETATGKMYVSGFDAECRPLLYMKPRLENTAASLAQVRHVVFHLEVAIAIMPPNVQSLCIVIDFAGASMTKTPGVSIAREILHVLGSHYPERLGKGYIIHAPWFFFPTYKLISPFIDPVTKAKINFVDMKKQQPKTIISTPSSAAASDVDLSSSSSSSRSAKGSSGDGSAISGGSTVTRTPTTTTTSSASSVATLSNRSDNNVNLLDLIPEDMLEQAFGGSSDYEYDQQAYWLAAEKVIARAREARERVQDPVV